LYDEIWNDSAAINIHIQVKRKPQRPTGISVFEIWQKFHGRCPKKEDGGFHAVTSSHIMSNISPSRHRKRLSGR
jgi:hypothetical protein